MEIESESALSGAARKVCNSCNGLLVASLKSSAKRAPTRHARMRTYIRVPSAPWLLCTSHPVTIGTLPPPTSAYQSVHWLLSKAYIRVPGVQWLPCLPYTRAPSVPWLLCTNQLGAKRTTGALSALHPGTRDPRLLWVQYIRVGINPWHFGVQ